MLDFTGNGYDGSHTIFTEISQMRLHYFSTWTSYFSRTIFWFAIAVRKKLFWWSHNCSCTILCASLSVVKFIQQPHAPLMVQIDGSCLVSGCMGKLDVGGLHGQFHNSYNHFQEVCKCCFLFTSTNLQYFSLFIVDHCCRKSVLQFRDAQKQKTVSFRLMSYTDSVELQWWRMTLFLSSLFHFRPEAVHSWCLIYRNWCKKIVVFCFKVGHQGSEHTDVCSLFRV